MYFEPKLEDSLELNEKKIQELERRTEALLREVQKFFSDLKFTPEQVDSFYNNEAHFSKKQWEAIQAEKKALEQQLELKLKQIRDPRETKKNQASRKIPSYAIFVR